MEQLPYSTLVPDEVAHYDSVYSLVNREEMATSIRFTNGNIPSGLFQSMQFVFMSNKYQQKLSELFIQDQWFSLKLIIVFASTSSNKIEMEENAWKYRAVDSGKTKMLSYAHMHIVVVIFLFKLASIFKVNVLSPYVPIISDECSCLISFVCGQSGSQEHRTSENYKMIFFCP